MIVTPADGLDNAGGRGFGGEVFTLGHLIESFQRHQRLMVRAGVTEPATVEWYANQFKHLAGVRDWPADALRTHHLAGVALTNAVTRAIKRLYKWAAAEDLVPKDPFAKLSIPPCGARTRTLTRAELRHLYLAAPRPLRLLLFVQLRTMARPGEIRNLTWGQIEWQHRVIVLAKFKAQKRRRDRKAVRLIPLPAVVQRLLANLKRKSPDPSPDGRVFRSTRFGAPWTANAVRCAVRTARKRAGLDGGGERVCCYHLRHTGATEASRNGMDLKLLAEVLGHTRTTTTERYLHLDATDMLRGIDRLNARKRTC